MEWLLALRRFAVRIGFTFMNRATSLLRIKTGMFSRNTITIGDINVPSPPNETSAPSSLPHGTPVAHYSFFNKKAIIGTKMGRLPIALDSNVHSQQVLQLHDLLQRFHERDLLAPLEDD